MLNATVKRKTNNKLLSKLKKKLEDLDDQKVQIGYFKEQGNHQRANMPYASLSYIHAYADEFGLPFPSRPVLPQIRPSIGGGVNQNKFFKGLLCKYMLSDAYSANDLLVDVGKKYQDDGRFIFGNAAYLAVTEGGNPTPLDDTGELKDNFAYRTSITMQYVV